jgi:hypothetical protein
MVLALQVYAERMEFIEDLVIRSALPPIRKS